MDPTTEILQLCLRIMGMLLALGWAVAFYRKFDRLYSVHLKDFLAPDVNKMARYPVAARYDAVNIEGKFWRYYFSGVFLVPLRFGMFVIFTCIGQVWVWSLMKVFGVTYANSSDYYNPVFSFLVRMVILPMNKIFVFICGFSSYHIKKHSIYDYLPNYEPSQDTKIAPIVLSNHCSFFEIIAHWQENISFLAKSSTSDVPFLGTQVLTKQMVYLTSHTEEGRKASELKLKQRLAKNMEGKWPQINVYPEGTLNNTDTIMKFKKGGFDHTYPIRIRCGRFFQDGYLSASFVNMNAYTFMLLWLSIPHFFWEFYELD